MDLKEQIMQEVKDDYDKKKKKTDNLDKKIFWICFSIFILAFIVSRFVLIVSTSGESMLPTLQEKEYYICNKCIKQYNYDDLVLVKLYKNNPFSIKIIKRIVGLPGDTLSISDGTLYINGIPEDRGFEKIENPGILSKPITLGDNEYFCMGDNRNHSSDSREFGAFSLKQIEGLLTIKIFPQ